MKTVTLVIISVMVASLALAQERKIVGRVVDEETDKPIGNVNIIIRGTETGTFTNVLGFFEITVADTTRTLFASHISYVASSINIPKEDRFKFALRKQLTRLETLFVDNFPMDTTKLPLLLCRDPKLKYAGELAVLESPACPPSGILRFYGLIGNSVAQAAKLSDAPVLGVTFTVDPTGHIINIQTSDSSSLLTAPLKRALTGMSPWTPAHQRGIPVAQGFTFLITHKGGLNDEALVDFRDFLVARIRYPYEADSEGVVNIEFTVDNEGKMDDFIALNDIRGCASEIKRRLREVPPESMKSLVKNTNAKRFLLPVVFTKKMPYTKNTRTTGSTAYRLLEVYAGHYIQSSAVRSETKMDLFSQAVQVRKISLDDAIRQAMRTKAISLPEQSYVSFPLEILRVEDLRSLNLEKNKLTELPREVGRLANLRELSLAENKLTVLPATFDDLRKLELLSLSSNELESFPQEILHLDALEKLDLSNNHIGSIPNGVSSLLKLNTLVLNNNRITTLPKVLGAMENLRNLHLVENKIETLPTYAFDGLKKLERLNLNMNELKKFPEEVLVLEHLEQLDLSNNSISKIPDGINSLSRLRALALTNNKLTTIPQTLLEMDKLEVLILKGNPIPASEIEKLKSERKSLRIIF